MKIISSAQSRISGKYFQISMPRIILSPFEALVSEPPTGFKFALMTAAELYKIEYHQQYQCQYHNTLI